MPSLSDVIERCKRPSPGRTPIVLFDLDGTLFDNGPRTWQILVDFAERAGNTELRRALDALPRNGLPYLLGDTLRKLGHTDAGLVEDALAFWRARFFTDDLQRFDEPVPGALHLTNQLFSAGATIVYLSGRDAPNMLVGCAASLRQHGFPVGIPRTVLLLKHAFEDSDLEFKRDALGFVDEIGEVVATFDNEPVNCNLFAVRWPQATHFLVDTGHAPNPPELLSSVLRVAHLSVST